MPERHGLRLQALAESAHAFAEATADIDRLFATVARRFADVIGDGCYVRLVGKDGVSLEPVATYHPDTEIERFLRETTDHVPLRIGEGISGRVVETGEAVLVPQVAFEEYRRTTKPEFVPIFERIGVTSLIVVCLRARATNLGFIALVRNGVGRPAYTEDDLNLVRDLADRAALAIDNARLLNDLERRVEARTKDLATANADLEAFSYSVSHDLRAPLRAIDGFSQILEDDHGPKLDDEGRRVLGVIRRSTQRMGRLIDDLLAFSRLGRQAMRPVRVDMQAMANNLALQLSGAEPARSIEFAIHDLPPAVCDAALIEQVWINLLGNAVKYTRPRERALIEVSGERAGGDVIYRVKDNGTGFDAKYASKLFQVFQRLHAATEFEGTGVGLALTQRIVARHGGRVFAEGELGKGATFGFSLPDRGTP